MRETRKQERKILAEAIRVLNKDHYWIGYDMSAPCAVRDLQDILETEDPSLLKILAKF